MLKQLLGKVPPGTFKERENENLLFNSWFEGGNLDKVYRIDGSKYHLYLRADSNTRGFF